MSSLYLEPRWQAAGASFEERYGTKVVSSMSDPKTEYALVRDSVGLTDFSFLQMYRIPEETAIDFLDPILAGNVAKTRFGRVTHTYLPDQDGNVLSDCYVANNDDTFILICESIVPTAEINDILDAHGAQDAGVENRNSTHVLLGLDGFDAWKVSKELFGHDVLGLPYLSVEIYPFEGEDVLLLRAGKTSEFGYLIMAPNAVADALCEKVQAIVQEVGGGLCGVSVHNELRLEGRFFNIHREGVSVRDPLTLGLQWMIDFDKETFTGSEALLARRAQGLTHKIIGLSASADGDALKPGAAIFHRGNHVADVVTTSASYVLDRRLGLGVFPVQLAYAGLEFTLEKADGPIVSTISMPPILPRSLTIRLDEV